MKYLALLLMLAPLTGRADVITEFGIGYKLSSTSGLLMPFCRQALIVDPEWWPDNPRGRGGANSEYGGTYSCGGDFPAFIGWTIAWESEWKGPWRARVGHFHYSNVFDGGELIWFGGDRRETSMDLIAATATFSWTKWWRARK